MRKYFIPLLCLSLLSLHVKAQGEAASSLFTGRMAYSIPLYTIEDPDFHLNIALHYNSDGFKPFRPSGCYGQDWSLVAGGCITRSIQGLPDDLNYYNRITKWCYSHNTHEKLDIRGYIIGIEKGFIRALMKMGEVDSIPDKESVFNMDSSVYNDSCGIKFRAGMRMDYMPDIFSFNFCGHSGSFLVNNSGKVVILSGDFVNVDVSGIGTQRGVEYEETTANFDQTVPKGFVDSNDKSTIIIKTTDGYSYVFGGNKDALGYSVVVHRDTIERDAFSVLDAWYITKIIAPNGRWLNFSYKQADSTRVLYYESQKIPRALHSFVTDYDWTEKTSYDDSTHIVYSIHKNCLLNSISTFDRIPLKINFYSSLESLKKYHMDDFPNCMQGYKLDSVIVSHNDAVLRKAYLNYLYRANDMVRPVYGGSNNGYYWRYLRQVYISGVGKYTMQYNNFEFHSSPVNNPWAYYQFKYPGLYVKHDENYKEKVDRMGFWRISSLQGMLSEVSLPTGGKVKFTYGAHQYGEERRFRAVGTKNVELYTQSNANQTIGGARIEKIETFSDDSTLVETKTFSYNKQGTNNSSGIYYNIYNVYYPDTVLSVANPYNYSMMDTHIGYSYVEQNTTIGTDSYKTAYTFYTGRNSYSSLNNNLIHRNDSVENYNDTTEVCSGSLAGDGWLVAPGKLLKAEQYNGNTLAKSIQFEYNGVKESAFGSQAFGANSLRCTDTIVCLSKYSAHVACKFFVCPDVVEKVTTHEYDANGQHMQTVQDMIYDTKLRKKEVRTNDSRGRQLFTKYTYPDDVVQVLPQDTTPLADLIHACRVGAPIETVSGYIDNESEYGRFTGLCDEIRNLAGIL